MSKVISALPEATNLNASDLFVIVQAGQTKHVTKTTLESALDAGGGTDEDWVREALVWSTATQTLSISYRQAYKQITLEADITDLTFDSIPSGFVQVFIEFIQDSTGGREITDTFWTDDINWHGDEPPAFDFAAANEVINVELWTDDQGTNWYGVHNKPKLLNVQTGTSYSPVLADNGTLVRMANANPITVTLQPASTTPFGIGATIAWAQWAGGAITFAEGTGVTIFSKDGLVTTNGQYSSAVTQYHGSDVWWLTGDLA